MSVSKSRIDSHRPAMLFLYGERVAIERTRLLGEFRLSPSGDEPLSKSLSHNQILPFGTRPSMASSGFLTLSLSTVWNEHLFHSAHGMTTCLVVHDTEEFGERLHRAVARALPQWAGIDAAVAYGSPSPLGAAFTKARHLGSQKEWLFAWRPIQPELSLQPIVVQIGSLDKVTEVREANATSR